MALDLTLATLAADPERIADVPPERVPELVGKAEALRAALWARLHDAHPPAPVESSTSNPDRLLTAKEAADVLGVNDRWLYRKADELPFTRRLSRKALRFSGRELRTWMSRQ